MVRIIIPVDWSSWVFSVPKDKVYTVILGFSLNVTRQIGSTTLNSDNCNFSGSTSSQILFAADAGICSWNRENQIQKWDYDNTKVTWMIRLNLTLAAVEASPKIIKL